MQEAVTNSLKHAHASRLRVTYLEDTLQSWSLSVTDDGTGFSQQPPTNGHGLNNMRTRATQAGLLLSIDNGSSGTTVCIRVIGEAAASVFA
jgi:signal transduction histidine kinase